MIKNRNRKNVLISLILAAAFCVLPGCRNTDPAPSGEGTLSVSSEDVVEPAVISQEVVEGQELMCLADDKEQAQQIADQYGIELVEFSYGVATFHTNEDPQKIIDMGKEMGYPELEINGYSHTMGD